MCPELIEAVKLLDILAYSRSYSEIFSDLIDWMTWQYLLIQTEDNPLEKYKEKERKLFIDIWQVIHTEVKKRVGMWTGNLKDWYDPLGRFYETITSRHKSGAMGQFFTPPSIVDVMTQMTIHPNSEKNLHRIYDPTCGSGRMGLAAASFCMANQVPCWITMVDIDPICTKMSAINMAMHGVVGEIICMNSLDVDGTSFRFSYRIEPALARVPKAQWELTQMAVFVKTGQDVKKQYVLLPISYEQTFLKGVNEQLLQEFEERKNIADETDRRKALEELQRTVEARLKGSLFEGDTILTENLNVKEKEKTTKKRRRIPPSKDNQGSLF